MAETLIIGSRESELAVIQARIVQRALQERHPDKNFEIKTYKTTGDRILDRTLDKIGGKGLFTKELEAALFVGEADLLVHSFKDVPMEVDARIPIVGVTVREDVRDALVLPQGERELSLTKPIGCSSLRRTLQLKALYPGCEVKPVRGNVQTRLRKLDSGEYGALCLAAAGLRRLGLQARIFHCFSTDEIFPAACQGTLALQARADFDRSLLKGLADEAGFAVSTCERSFVRTLNGGCSSPVAAYAEIHDGRIHLRGLYVEEDNETMHFDTAEGAVEDAGRIGAQLAENMKNRWGKHG